MKTIQQIIEENNYLQDSILIGYRGSIAHGMYVPNTDPNSIDDRDIMAVIIPPVDTYLGLKHFGSRGTKEILPSDTNEWDVVTYEFIKYIKLLINSNPNVLSLLWLDEDLYVQRSKEGQELINNRDLFISKEIYKSFTGYAYGQLKRMEHFKFEGYMGEKRKALVTKHGYDCKNAAHCIRLLRMGIEFLNEGILYVNRKGIDSEELLEIKTGKWTLEQVKKEAMYVLKKAEEAYCNSKLQERPEEEKINKLCIELIKSKLHLNEIIVIE